MHGSERRPPERVCQRSRPVADGAAPRCELFLCGDVMIGRGIDQVLAYSCPPDLYESFITSALDYVHLAERVSGPIPRRVDSAYVWGDALPALDGTRLDARIINLETSITECGVPVPKGINYRVDPRNLSVLTAARIDCCVLANNHVGDFGEAGLVETLETLARAGIQGAGAGQDLACARAPAVLDLEGKARVLVFAFGAVDAGIPPGWAAGIENPGVHFLPDYSRRSARAIAELVFRWKRPSDIAVASIHWGGNWGYAIAPAHRNFAHRLIDSAAIDVVHGHSSHHPKGIEVYRDRLILYGCGDFLNDYEGIGGDEEFRGDLVLMYFPTLEIGTGRLLQLIMVPLRIRNFRLNQPTDVDRAWLRDTIDRECARFGHGVRLDGENLQLTW